MTIVNGVGWVEWLGLFSEAFLATQVFDARVRRASVARPIVPHKWHELVQARLPVTTRKRDAFTIRAERGHLVP
eukprot:6492324-Amphidinium_carterae.1